MAERWDAAAPYRDIFEKLANRTITMLDDRSKQEGPFLSSSANTGALDEGGLSDWVTQVTNAGIPEEFDGLFSSLAPEYLPESFSPL